MEISAAKRIGQRIWDGFKIDVIVWKYLERLAVKGIRDSFKIDVIVWKLHAEWDGGAFCTRFKIDVIVWKYYTGHAVISTTTGL